MKSPGEQAALDTIKYFNERVRTLSVAEYNKAIDDIQEHLGACMESFGQDVEHEERMKEDRK